MPSPGLVRPEVISSSLSPRAITLTFSKPMDPASVEDVSNYSIWGTSRVTLKSASHDPASRAVTLTPAEPLAPASYTYFASFPGGNPSDFPRRPLPPGAKTVTDLQGIEVAVPVRGLHL